MTSRAYGLALSFVVALAGCVVGTEDDGAGGDRDGDGNSGGSGGSGGTGSGGGATAGPANRLRIDGNRIVDDKGAPVRLTGINWFGLETDSFAPHGLWLRSMDSMLDQIVGAGFNVLRVPFSSQLLDPGATPTGIDTALNPDLAGKSGPEVLDALIAKASARGLRIILDRHRPDAAAQSELWYTAAYSEQRWIADWVKLAQKYRANPMVVAFDLHNEPHGTATWGSGVLATDWRLAAQRAGNAILAVHPEILIIVEGVEVVGGNYYWWGGNLRGAAAAPVSLDLPNHVIYSPHEYPASLYAQPWFSDPTYPANLPAVWDATWGGLAATAPVLIGEFGSKLETESDRLWLGKLASYIQAKGLSFTFWALNPNSGDTGGLLLDDWHTIDTRKQGYLSPIQAPLLPLH
jgi:endoglucanase